MIPSLEKDSRNILLTPEFVVKSDLDIQSIRSVYAYSKQHNLTAILTGGYATEAHLGGKITRAHGDVDFVLLNPSNILNEQIFVGIRELLSAEITKWKFEQSNPNKIDCREDRDDIPFNNRRRIEFKIREDSWTESAYVAKSLQDSNGNIVKIFVVGLYPMLAEKIHKFYLIKDGVDTSKDRESSLSDVVDLARLIKLGKIDTKLLNNEEYDYVLQLLNNLKPQISKYLSV